MIRLGKDLVSNYNSSSSREWLETTGIGGYASGTVSGANSRRYHGLLVAATKPPVGRMVLLSKFEECVIYNGKRYELSSNCYPGTIHPKGYEHLKSFCLDPFPTWVYAFDGIEIERSIHMVAGENTTVCRWRVLRLPDETIAPPEVELRPLVAFRDHHHLRHEEPDLDGTVTTAEGLVSIKPVPELPTLYFAHSSGEIGTSGYWYRNFEYAIEKERGFDYTEDLFQPFVLTLDLSDETIVIASTESRSIADAHSLRESELQRRAKLIAASGAKEDLKKQLVLAADQFVVDRGEGKTVIAGYHWFSDWGRDTMIALPGLTLATNRPEIAKSIILEFSKHISEGMLPNRFPDAGEEAEYNTVDATLWYFEAIRAYVEKTGDYALASELFGKLGDIIEWHIRGTRYGIRVDEDGLLRAGEPGVQLTWMDAKIGDWIVTPRTGKPVEIQALWYNALRSMADLAERFGHSELSSKYDSMASLAKESFQSKFWFEDGGYLCDVINEDGCDTSLRPNQIFAISVHHPLVSGERARQVVDTIEQRLLTPVGLRSLDASDPRYVGTYIGSPFERDSSYHQGTVWAWLIGPFVEAYRKTHAKDRNLIKREAEMLTGLSAHLSEAGLGQVSEIFDADPPHAPRGCAAQAWSVAEILRVLDVE